jgi:hypothetical protein
VKDVKPTKLSCAQVRALKGLCGAVRRNKDDKTKPLFASIDAIKTMVGVHYGIGLRLPTDTLGALVRAGLATHKKTKTDYGRWRPTAKGFKLLDELPDDSACQLLPWSQ